MASTRPDFNFARSPGSIPDYAMPPFVRSRHFQSIPEALKLVKESAQPEPPTSLTRLAEARQKISQF